jgi:tetrahydromethanopterin S-methyltransferase subunit A
MNEKKELEIIDIKDLNSIEKIVNEVETAFFDIPFGNTGFQTKAFVVAAAITPERSYRQIGLQLLSVLNSLRNNIVGRQIQLIKIKQKENSLNDGSLDVYEKEIIELELLLEKTGQLRYEKTLNDLIHEFAILYQEFKKLPKFTREQFESAEENYFNQSLGRQVNGITGAAESIINMREDIKALDDYKEKIKLIENLDFKTLEDLRTSMSNQIENARKEKNNYEINYSQKKN